jgi:hypothetical protein
MHKSATKCNETIGKWCKNKHGASKIIDTFETYHIPEDMEEQKAGKRIPGPNLLESGRKRRSGAVSSCSCLW